MFSIIVRRLGQGLLVLAVLYTATFFLVRTLPGGPFLEEKAIPEHIRVKMLEQYGLKDPKGVQYVANLGRLARGDLGPSTMMEGRPVERILRQSFPASFQLGVAAMAVALLIGLPAGILAAARKNTLVDYSSMAIAMLGICIPSFVIGPVLATWLGQSLQILPAAGWEGLFSTSWILPAFTLGLINAAYISRLTRAGMLEVLGQDYIRTAMAKGVSPFRILTVHAMRGGLIPAIAYLGPAFAATISGSIVIERIFHIPGMGQNFIKAIEKNDPFLIQGAVLLYGTLIVGAVLLSDLLQIAFNPRLRQS